VKYIICSRLPLLLLCLFYSTCAEIQIEGNLWERKVAFYERNTWNYDDSDMEKILYMKALCSHYEVCSLPANRELSLAREGNALHCRRLSQRADDCVLLPLYSDAELFFFIDVWPDVREGWTWKAAEEAKKTLNVPPAYACRLLLAKMRESCIKACIKEEAGRERKRESRPKMWYNPRCDLFLCHLIFSEKAYLSSWEEG